MEKKYKYLSKNLILFGLSTVFPRAISFLMVPLYTNCLTTGEYGIGDIVTTSASLALPIFSLSIYSGILRFGFDENYKKSDILTSGIIILLRGICICYVLCLACIIIPFVNIPLLYLFAFLMFFISNGFYEIFTNYARTVEKINIIVEMAVLNTFSTGILNIVFLLIFQLRLDGYLTANYLGTLISVIYGVFRLKVWNDIEVKFINKKTFIDLQRYSAPLILNRIGWWINNSSDRYIITWLLSSSANGIYTVAYKIPTILTAFSDVFAQAWQLSAIKEFEKDDKENFVSDMYCTYNSIITVCCSILIIITVPLAKVLYAKDFFDAWKIVPLLLISFMFNGLASFFGSIFVAVKDSKIISSSTILAAIINIILNIALIVLIKDPIGAAIATVISYIVIWLQRYICVRKYINLHISLWNHILIYIFLFIQYGFCLMGFNVFSVLTQVAILLCIVFINRKELINMIKKIIIKFLVKNGKLEN